VNTLHLIHNTPPETKQQPALKDVVAKVVRRYLHDMGQSNQHDLYDVLLAEVEPALLIEVMAHCRGNQSRAAEVLGLNRATLRKKLLQYGINSV
jgi:Fis family transcriptional regulator